MKKNLLVIATLALMSFGAKAQVKLPQLPNCQTTEISAYLTVQKNNISYAASYFVNATSYNDITVHETIANIELAIDQTSKQLLTCNIQAPSPFSHSTFTATPVQVATLATYDVDTFIALVKTDIANQNYSDAAQNLIYIAENLDEYQQYPGAIIYP